MLAYRTAVTLIALSPLLIGQISAKNCPRCTKIEQQREQDVALNGPEPIHYYDDAIVLTTPQDKSTSSSSSQYGTNDPSIHSHHVNNKDINGTSLHVPESKQDNLSNTYQEELIEKSYPSNKEFSHSYNYGNSMPNTSLDDQNRQNRQTYSTIFIILQSKNFLETFNGPFTLFIPSNDALRQLPAGLIQDLMRPENQDKLSHLIGNHVIAEKLIGDDLALAKVKTLSGKSLDIKTDQNKIKVVNGANVLKVEHIGPNGVIYIIDRVL